MLPLSESHSIVRAASALLAAIEESRGSPGGWSYRAVFTLAVDASLYAVAAWIRAPMVLLSRLVADLPRARASRRSSSKLGRPGRARELLLEIDNRKLQLLRVAAAQRVQLLLHLRDQTDELLVVFLKEQRRFA